MNDGISPSTGSTGGTDLRNHFKVKLYRLRGIFGVEVCGLFIEKSAVGARLACPLLSLATILNLVPSILTTRRPYDERRIRIWPLAIFAEGALRHTLSPCAQLRAVS
jgi:hypothetical protein